MVSLGVGKSTQALHYAHRFHGTVRWISADSELKVDNGFREIGEILKIHDSQTMKKSILIQRLNIGI